MDVIYIMSSEEMQKNQPLRGLADLSRRELNPGLKRDKLAYWPLYYGRFQSVVHSGSGGDLVASSTDQSK